MGSAELDLSIRNVLADVQVIMHDLFCTFVEEKVSQIVFDKQKKLHDKLHEVNLLVTYMLNEETVVSDPEEV